MSALSARLNGVKIGSRRSRLGSSAAARRRQWRSNGAHRAQLGVFGVNGVSAALSARLSGGVGGGIA